MTSSVSDPGASASLPTAMRGGRADPLACKHGQSWGPPSSQPPCLAWTTFEHHGRMKVGEVAALVRGSCAACCVCASLPALSFVQPTEATLHPDQESCLEKSGRGFCSQTTWVPTMMLHTAQPLFPICQAGMMAAPASEGFGGDAPGRLSPRKP